MDKDKNFESFKSDVNRLAGDIFIPSIVAPLKDLMMRKWREKGEEGLVRAFQDAGWVQSLWCRCETNTLEKCAGGLPCDNGGIEAWNNSYKKYAKWNRFSLTGKTPCTQFSLCLDLLILDLEF